MVAIFQAMVSNFFSRIVHFYLLMMFYLSLVFISDFLVLSVHFKNNDVHIQNEQAQKGQIKSVSFWLCTVNSSSIVAQNDLTFRILMYHLIGSLGINAKEPKQQEFSVIYGSGITWHHCCPWTVVWATSLLIETSCLSNV